MTSIAALAWLFLLIALGAWLLGCLASELVSRVAFGKRLSPMERRQRSFILAAIPLMASGAVLIAVGSTALGKSAGWILDHCVYHGAGHPHLCFTHLPAIRLGLVEFFTATLVLVSLAVVVGRFVLREHHAGQRIRSLVRLAASRTPARRLCTVEDPSPFAVTAGAFAPRVILSRGLLEGLEAREGRIVVSHEFSHIRARDLLYNLVFETLLLLQWPATAGRLRSEWRQAMEEGADDRVAGRFGREQVAATLLKVFRLQRDHSIPGLSVAGADPLARIERLLSQEHSRGTGILFAGTCLASIAIFALVLAGAHHQLETLLGFLTGH
ncbi:M56 family metallopeptidase [Microbulbifer yueqingensis]|uniref:Signal transducer regulating beta-lactamase production, contains metallopeptidase domain n=1 Tax=Microbulbifer yueqingensis TaxID=658219 RepID=A0A1G8UBQ3_9GAMM|nr:M56 family metallopeptidase [Microbulbifer yueqingensis]SDJ51183.1 Signal transducer regulating beta-lactamase production, contains metallopeptidase domain [Microbulbifer yueqingensis]